MVNPILLESTDSLVRRWSLETGLYLMVVLGLLVLIGLMLIVFIQVGARSLRRRNARDAASRRVAPNADDWAQKPLHDPRRSDAGT